MKLRIRALTALCGVMLLGAAVAPPEATAQGRIAVRRVPGRTVVVRAFYYRPYLYDPWYFGVGSPYYPPFGYYGYPGRYYGGYESAVRLQVRPREAEVFVDGYYAGTVDDFDGIFQRLHLEPGEHEIELYLPGHRLARERLYLQPGRTSSIRLAMEPLAPGDSEPARPTPTAPPPDRPDVRDDQGPDRPDGRDDRARDRRPRPGDRRADPRDLPADDRPGDRDGSYGSISIRVQPGDAMVLIDGEEWEGPADDERLVVEVSAGRHVIEVRKDGYRRYSTELEVPGGETETLNVALTQDQ